MRNLFEPHTERRFPLKYVAFIHVCIDLRKRDKMFNFGSYNDSNNNNAWPIQKLVYEN